MTSHSTTATTRQSGMPVLFARRTDLPEHQDDSDRLWNVRGEDAKFQNWRRGRAAMGVELPIEIGAGRHDAVGLALLTLAQELWVVKDRQMVTEALLREHGLLEALDSYQPDLELATRLAAERDRFVRSITTVLLTAKPAEI